MNKQQIGRTERNTACFLSIPHFPIVSVEVLCYDEVMKGA